ncbi:MAG: insulinase family protein [Candidatus Heimdallarchaeota archaeon]|nr:insulinase family protein [Candidatus Heimdallarchaeota archaeon]
MESENKVIISRSNLKTVSFGISIPVGSANEPIPGLTDIMITHMLRNTDKYSEKDFADLIDKYGIRAFSDVDRTSSMMGFKVPPQHLKKSLEIFSDIWQNPGFKQDNIGRMVQQQIGFLQEIKSTPEDIVTNYTKWDVAFGHDPITKHPYGTIEALQDINVEKMVDWHKKILEYKPNFASVGYDINSGKYSDYGLDDLLSLFGNKSYNESPITRSNNELNIKIDTPEMESSNSYIGVNIRGRDPAENNYSEDLFRSIISGGMSARMFNKIREELNLSYAPRLSGERFTKGSLYTALMDVRPDRATEALETTVNLLHEALTQPIEKEEMQRALKISQRIAVFVSDSSSSYTNFILDRLTSNREYDLKIIKNKLDEVAQQDWQSQMLEFWQKNNISLAVSGETGDLPQKWEEIMEQVF